MMAVPLSAQNPRPTREVVAAIRGALVACDPSTRALLRRLDPESPGPAFYRVTTGTLDHLECGAPVASRRTVRPNDSKPGLAYGAAVDREARWAVVVCAMARSLDLLGRVPLGEALFLSAVPEHRVLRLLAAHDQELFRLVLMVTQALVQRGQPFDDCDLADLVLSDGTEGGKETRRRIACGYYGPSASSVDLARE